MWKQTFRCKPKNIRTINQKREKEKKVSLFYVKMDKFELREEEKPIFVGWVPLNWGAGVGTIPQIAYNIYQPTRLFDISVFTEGGRKYYVGMPYFFVLMANAHHFEKAIRILLDKLAQYRIPLE